MADEEEDGVGRRFLQHLQQRVGRRCLQVVRRVDDDRSPFAERRRNRQKVAQRTDLVDADVSRQPASRPFQPFEQLESLLLFVIALLIGIFSIARGARWDDPYPGYGPRHRRLEEARERAHEIALRLSREIDQAKDLAARELGEIAIKSRQHGGALRQAIARAQDQTEGRGVREPAFVEDAVPSGRAEGSDDAFVRASANVTACKSQIARVRAQVAAEYLSFYDNELLPFLRGIVDEASVSVRSTSFAPGPSPTAKGEADA